MRYATVVLYPDPGLLHPIEQQLAAEPSLTRRAIHDVKELDDGTIAMLAEVEGDLDRYREIMADSPAVRTFAVSGDDSGYVYSQVEPTPLTEELLADRRDRGYVVQTPVEYTEDGGMRVTVVGNDDDLAAVGDLPAAVDVELVSTGPYHPEAEGVFADLTERQREVLETALELGYYETPRQATVAEVAAELDVEPGTVGKHLRAVEATVFSKYVR